MPKKVAIVYYSMYGHVKILADAIKEGLEAQGVIVDLLQVPETLPQEVLEKMHAPPKDETVPTANAADLPQYSGIIFGIPTRFGMAASQMKSFWDSTGGLWSTQALAGKPAGVFFSTATQNGGQETTAMTWMTQLVHQGMVYVPLGYTAGAPQFDLTEPHGGSPWGPGTLAGGDGSRMPSQAELDVAKHYGTYFAGFAEKLGSDGEGAEAE